MTSGYWHIYTIYICHMIYLYNCLQKRCASRDGLVPRLKFIIMCATIHSLKSTYTGSFVFDLHRKFLFLKFVSRKRNIFSGISCLFFISRPWFWSLLFSVAEIFTISFHFNRYLQDYSNKTKGT